MEEDTTTNDFVGSTSFDIIKLCTKEPLDQWIDVSFESKPAGKLHIRTEFKPYPPGTVSSLSNLKKKEDEIDYYALIGAIEDKIAAKDASIREKDEKLATYDELISIVKEKSSTDIQEVTKDYMAKIKDLEKGRHSESHKVEKEFEA